MPTRKQNAGFWLSLFAIFLWFASGTIAHAQTATHIKGLWHLDEVNTVTVNTTTTLTTPDSSGHGNVGTLAGTVGPVHGKWEHALGFNGGANDYVDIQRTNDSLDLTASLTIEGWIYPTAADCGAATPSHPFYQTVVGKWGLGGHQAYWLGLYTDCTLRGEISPDGSTTDFAEGGTVVPINQWHHVAMVYDSSSKTIRVYLDGVDDTVSTHGSPAGVFNVTDRDVGIGGWNFPVGPPRGLFTGKIDEVRIWDRSLTPEEIMSSAQAGLRALWHFDNNLVDYSGYRNMGTNHGATFAAHTDSYLDDAASFDGTDEFISVDHSSTLDMTSAYTVEGWVYLDSSVTRYLPIVVRGDATTGENDIEIYLQDEAHGRNLTVVHNRNNTGTFSYAYFTPPPLSTWFYLAVTFDGTTVSVYYDGELEGSASLDPPLATGKGWLLGQVSFGGSYDNPYYLKGLLDELHVWARALNEDEVAFIAGESGSGAPAAPLFIPDIWKETFGSGAVYGSDWHVGNTSPATVLQMVVPDDPDTAIETNDEHGVIQTPKPPSDAALDGFVLGNANLDALITGEQGDKSKTLHLSTTLTDGIELKSLWNPGQP